MRMLARNWSPLIHAVSLALAGALAGSLALLWVWNTVAHGLLGAPKGHFSQALVGLTLAVVGALAWKHRRR